MNPLFEATVQAPFAGEQTSRWPGGMQGALAAGNRVARELGQAP